MKYQPKQAQAPGGGAHAPEQPAEADAPQKCGSQPAADAVADVENGGGAKHTPAAGAEVAHEGGKDAAGIDSAGAAAAPKPKAAAAAEEEEKDDAAAPAAKALPFGARLRLLLASGEVWLFLWQSALQGFGLGVYQGFLFLALADMGASELLMGLSITVDCLVGGRRVGWLGARPLDARGRRTPPRALGPHSRPQTLRVRPRSRRPRSPRSTSSGRCCGTSRWRRSSTSA